MRKSRFTEEQMVKILREADKVPVAEIAKKYGVGDASLEVLEQRLPAAFDLRYVYRTKPNQVLSVSLSTGLRLGDKAAIRGRIRVKNSDSSSGNVLIRVNGQLVG